MNERKLMSIEELSEYIDTPVATIYTWTHLRRIPHVKIGRSLKFERGAVDRWVEAQRVEPAVAA